MSKMICDCGRSFTNQSGFTLHKKTCQPKQVQPKKEPKKESNSPSEPSGNGNGRDHLSHADRREIQRLIIRRQDTLLKAMTEEIDGRPESIAERLRAERNVTLTVSQIKDLLNKVEQQIKDDTEPHLEDEKEKLNVKKADIDDEYGKLERDMRERHKKEYREICEKKTSEKQKISEEIRAVEQKVVIERCSHLVVQRQSLQSQLIATEKAEAEVQAQLNTQVIVIKRNRGRIESLIREAANSALEDLVAVGDRIAAQALIKRIPTLTEAINMIQQKDGLDSFMRRLNPDIKALPYVRQENMTIDVKAAAAIVHDNTDDEEEDVDSQVEEHENEVYDN